jgi:hypothetical protein
MKTKLNFVVFLQEFKFDEFDGEFRDGPEQELRVAGCTDALRFQQQQWRRGRERGQRRLLDPSPPRPFGVPLPYQSGPVGLDASTQYNARKTTLR